MRICIYEDRRTADLEPLTHTRPASDLLCGMDSLGEKQARYFAAEISGYLCRPHLAASVRERRPDSPVNDPSWLRSAPTVLVNARWLPPAPAGLRLAPATRRLFAGGPSIGTCNGDPAFAVLDTRRLQTIAPGTIDECLTDLSQSLPAREVGGHFMNRPWDLIEQNPVQIEGDFAATCNPTDVGHHPTGFAVVGPADRLFIHPSAKIDPMVVADTSKGPVWIGPDTVVAAFTRLEGPCAIGAGTHLLGAAIRAGTTIGPVCRIGGEVECSIVQGYANKYHDGFLGHSYIGEWVNLAAGTITGDLRFDYQPIAIRRGGTRVPTGQIKLGSIIGDHARTGLGVLLDCGSTVGAFASLLPTGQLAPREVPSFARCGPNGITFMEVDAVLRGSATAMSRRGRELTLVLEALYRSIMGRKESRPLPFLPPLELRKSA
jgi:UDP-N-acetylglucosamine diphosphorylase / glucose-1-phosphate thymidylyltransferase / UDP-N-acetylgalactosamine diphosphorylase / glucosamine-1-phosphate N-acetyltransferase / galactosamine-1-phosphate N-acetyltransferase